MTLLPRAPRPEVTQETSVIVAGSRTRWPETRWTARSWPIPQVAIAVEDDLATRKPYDLAALAALTGGVLK